MKTFVKAMKQLQQWRRTNYTSQLWFLSCPVNCKIKDDDICPGAFNLLTAQQASQNITFYCCPTRVIYYHIFCFLNHNCWDVFFFFLFGGGWLSLLAYFIYSGVWGDGAKETRTRRGVKLGSVGERGALQAASITAQRLSVFHGNGLLWLFIYFTRRVKISPLKANSAVSCFEIGDA